MTTISIIEEDFKQAEAILKDLDFELRFDPKDERQVAILKIIKARKENIDFELGLAERITGDNNKYPSRTGQGLTKFFNDLGYRNTHTGETKRYWVQKVLKQFTAEQLFDVIHLGIFKKGNFISFSQTPSLTSKTDSNQLIQAAVTDFNKFLDDSIAASETVSLISVFGLNFNSEMLFKEEIETTDEELNKLVKEAKSRFLNNNEKQIALEKLWDAFERIKTYFGSGKQKSKSAEQVVEIISNNFDKDCLNDEFDCLTKLGNTYRIRHHETDKKEIVNPQHADYLFFRMLNLLTLCLRSLKENK